jgi:hypothetical protein
MIDTAVAAPAVVEAAPVITPEAPVVETQAPTEDVALETGKSGDEAQQPLSKRDARRGLHESRRAKKEAQPLEAEDATEGSVIEAVSETAEETATRVAGEEQARVNAAGRKFDPATGQFLPNESAAAVAAGAPKGIVVPIPQGHPLLEMGQPEITAASPEQEQVIRAALNGTYARIQEVKAKDTLLAERDATILQLKERLVRGEASVAAQAKYPDSPLYKAHANTYNEIRDTVSQEAASAFWQSPAVQNDLRPIEDGEFNTRWEAEQARADQEAGDAWVSTARGTAQSTLPPEMVALPVFSGLFDSAVASFDAEVGSGVYGDPSTLTAEKLHEKFGEILRVHLLRDESMRSALDVRLKARDRAEATNKQEDERRTASAAAATAAAVKAAAAAAAVQAGADTRRQAPPHPFGALNDATRGIHASGSAGVGPEDGPDLSQMNTRQLRKTLRTGARQDARIRHTST